MQMVQTQPAEAGTDDTVNNPEIKTKMSKPSVLLAFCVLVCIVLVGIMPWRADYYVPIQGVPGTSDGHGSMLKFESLGSD